MLLLDQNLSDKIVPALQTAFPGSIHVKSLKLDKAEDSHIWQIAFEQKLTIVSNDDDFEHLAEFRGFPPKVIHLLKGNLSRKEMLSILLDNAQHLHSFINSDTEGYIALI